MTNSIQIKSYLFSDDLKPSINLTPKVNEIRRFNLNFTNDNETHKLLLDNLQTLYSNANLDTSKVKTYWIDEDNELIRFSNEKEFQYALKYLENLNQKSNSKENFTFKVYVAQTDSPKVINHQKSNYKNDLNFINDRNFKCYDCKNVDCMTCRKNQSAEIPKFPIYEKSYQRNNAGNPYNHNLNNNLNGKKAYKMKDLKDLFKSLLKTPQSPNNPRDAYANKNNENIKVYSRIRFNDFLDNNTDDENPNLKLNNNFIDIDKSTNLSNSQRLKRCQSDDSARLDQTITSILVNRKISFEDQNETTKILTEKVNSVDDYADASDIYPVNVDQTKKIEKNLQEKPKQNEENENEIKENTNKCETSEEVLSKEAQPINNLTNLKEANSNIETKISKDAENSKEIAESVTNQNDSTKEIIDIFEKPKSRIEINDSDKQELETEKKENVLEKTEAFNKNNDVITEHKDNNEKETIDSAKI